MTSPRDTNNIRISYRSGDPETAFVVAGSLVDSYLKFTDGYYHTNAQRSLDLLRSEKQEQERQLNELKERKLALIEVSKLLPGAGDEKMTHVLTEGVKQLAADLTEATSRRLKAEAQLHTVRRAIETGGDLQQIARQMSESVGTKLFEKVVGCRLVRRPIVAAQMAAEDLLDLQVELEELKDYLRSRGIERSRISRQEIQSRTGTTCRIATGTQGRQAVSRLANADLGPMLHSMAREELQSATNEEEAIFTQFQQESQKAAKFSKHLNEIEMIDKQIEIVHASLAELSKSIANTGFGQQQGLQTQIVTDPQIVRAPVSPKLSLVVLVSFVLGFAGGGAVIYLLDLVDDRFHSAEDMKSQVGAPILTSIQKLKPLSGTGIKSLYTFTRPNAPESESFRTLRTALDFSAGGARRLTISSTQPSDGKTTVLSNLGVAFAQAGRKTLIIDGDMRRPGLTRLFERSGYNGLSTVLRDDRAIVESVSGLVYHTELENLHILPAGPKPINPVELLTSERLSDLLAWAETQYDQVLIDAPPSLAVTDAAIIGRLVEGAILTVRPDRNRRKGILRAAEALTSLGCELHGIVLNQIEPTHATYGFGYGYGYGYGSEDPAEEQSDKASRSTSSNRKRAA